jgi:hypothetical protein
MARLTLLTLFSLLWLTPFAQDTWRLMQGKKQLFASHSDDMGDSKKVVTLTAKDLNKLPLTVIYKQALEEKDWARSVMVHSDKDVDILNLQGKTSSGTFTLPAAKIKAALLKYKSLYIYSICLPTDPELAKAVRVRRVVICRLQLK